MGIFDRLFRSREQEPDDEQLVTPYFHPEIGELWMEFEDSWLIQDAHVQGFGSGISVQLRGDRAGPSEEALASFQWFTEDPVRLFAILFDDILELHKQYSREISTPVKCDNIESVVSASEVLHVYFRSKTDLEVTLRFKWQHTDDGHYATFYVENGESQGASIDG